MLAERFFAFDIQQRDLFMIDLLLLIGIIAGVLTLITKNFSLFRLVLTFAGLSCMANAVCLTVLYTTDARYTHVINPSRSFEAGIKAPGLVHFVNDSSVSSLGAFLAMAFTPGEAKILGKKEEKFSRSYPPSDRWKFWQALDSYIIEEAAGGLVFFPRRPIWRNAEKNNRIISVHGVETNSIESFLNAVAAVPPTGVFNVRIMSSTPDTGVDNIPLSPLFYKSSIPEIYFGISGLPVVLAEPGREWFFLTLYRAGHQTLHGPADLQREIHMNSVNWIPAAHGAQVFMRPRLALLPMIYENIIVSWVASTSGVYLRQLLGLKNLWYMAVYWSVLPKQWYLLDDGIGAASLFFKIGSLFASLALSLLALLFIHRCFPRRQKFVHRNRTKLILLTTMLFQLTDIFVFRLF